MANIYWVGGTGTWDATTTTNWSLTSGGAGGAGVPTTADDVIIDTNSGTGSVSGAGNNACRNLTITATQALLLNSGTLNNLNGNFVMPPVSSSCVWGMQTQFRGTTAGRTITTNGQSGGSNWFFNDGGDWTLIGNMTVAGTFGILGGTFNTGNYNITCGAMQLTGSITRTLNCGSSTITVSGTYDSRSATNLTLNAGTSNFIFSSVNLDWFSDGRTFYDVSFTGTTQNGVRIYGVNTFHNLTITPEINAAGYKTISLEANQTVTGTLSSPATNPAYRTLFNSSVAGTQRTLSIATMGTVTNTDFQDIALTGVASPWTASFGDGDYGNNTGITFNTQTAYWIGGTGNWLDNTHWSLSSGGSAVSGSPQSTNSVIFDANSNVGTGAFTVTANSGASGAVPYINCNSFSTSSLDGVMTLAPISYGTINIYGSLTLPSSNFVNAFTGVATIKFASTSTGNTITTGGNSLNCGVIFNGVGGGWTLTDTLTYGSITVTAGTFNTGNQTLTSTGGRPDFTSTGALVRAINLGSSTVLTYGMTISGTNLTFNAGTSQINLGATNAWGVGIPLTFYNFTCLGPMAPQTGNILSQAHTFYNFTLTAPTSTGISTVLVSANITINGTFASGGATVTNRVLLTSDTVGTARTLTAAAVSLSNVDFQDINAAGTASWSDASRTGYWGDCKGNTGITFAPGRNVYWNLAGVNVTKSWGVDNGFTLTSGGTPAITSFPLAQDTAIFNDANAMPSGTGSFLTYAAWNFPTIDFSGRTLATTVNIQSAVIVYGNWTNGSGITLTGTANLTFAGRTTQTITSAGKTFTMPITLNSIGGTLQILDNLTSTNSFTLNNGTLNLNNNTLTITSFSSAVTTTRSIAFGTGNITITGSNATIWNTPTATNFSYTGTPTINCTYSGSIGTRTIATANTTGGTETNAVSFNISAGSDIVAITSGGTASFKNLNFTGFTGTFATAASQRTIYGNLTISSTMTCTAGVGPLNFLATSGTQQITTNGNTTIDFPVTFNGTSTYQLQDAFTTGSTRTTTLTSGTLDLNNKVLSTGLFSSSNSNTRSILFGTGNITLTGNSTTIWSTATATNFSYTGTPTVNCTYSGSTGTRTVTNGTTGGTESNAISFNISAGSDTFVVSSGTNQTIKNLNFTGFTGTFSNTVFKIYGNLTLSSGMTLTAGTATPTFAATLQQQNITTAGQTLDFPITLSGTNTYQLQDALTMGSTRTLTFSSGTLQFKAGTTNTVGSFVTSGTTITYLQSDTAGTQATITKASGTTNASYIFIQDSNATGGTWNATNAANISDNTGWVFSEPLTTLTIGAGWLIGPGFASS
jgi:hypothetical protein